MRNIEEMQKLLESGTVSYEAITQILNLPDINGSGYVNVNQPSTFFLPPLGFFPENTIAINKLYDNLKSECLAELFLKDPETIDKLNLPGIINDFEYVALKNVMQNEQKAVAIIDAMMQASPRYDNVIISILQFAVINGKDNITNHILDGFSGFDGDSAVLCRFIRFLVELSRFDVIKRLIGDDDEQTIRDILNSYFWEENFTYTQHISNAEAACRYLEEMLVKLYNKKQIKEIINEEINHPYNMEHLILSGKDLDDLAKHGVTITNATLVAAAVWDEAAGDFDDELFNDKIKPLLADNLTLSLGELVDYFSQRTCYRDFNISKVIAKTVELVGEDRLTVILSDINYEYDLPEENYFIANSIIASINGNGVKALLKIPNYTIEPDVGYNFIKKLTVYVPRLIIGLVKKGVITDKMLDAVLDVAINIKNYDLINQLRLAVT